MEDASMRVKDAYWHAIREVDPQFGLRDSMRSGQQFVQALGYYISEYNPALFPKDTLNRFHPFQLGTSDGPAILPNIEDIELGEM